MRLKGIDLTNEEEKCLQSHADDFIQTTISVYWYLNRVMQHLIDTKNTYTSMDYSDSCKLLASLMVKTPTWKRMETYG